MKGAPKYERVILGKGAVAGIRKEGRKSPFLVPVSSRFVLSQFRGPDHLATWNRLVVFGILNDCLKKGIQFHHLKF